MRRTDLWHGGAPGRQIGDLLLPPDSTGLAHTSATLSARLGFSSIAHRRDRVYVTTVRDLARVYAGGWINPDLGTPGYGWLYRVCPGDVILEPDEDLLSLPGVSLQTPAARVEAVYEKAVAPDQPRFRRILTKLLEAHAAAKHEGPMA